MKRTPGPWEVSTKEHGEFVVAVNYPHVIVAEILGPTADARLIAAAPDEDDSLREMVAACAAAMRVLDHHGLAIEFGHELKLAGVENGFGKRALDALRKAEGKETP